MTNQPLEQTTSHTQTQTARHRWWLAPVCLLAVLLLLATAFVTGMKIATASGGSRSITTHATTTNALCPMSASSWTPTGVKWRLRVTFLIGPRQGQTEVSLMTFACNGTLTEAFPSAVPGDPAILTPTSDGQWEMTGPRAFRYAFRETLGQGTSAISVHVTVDAVLTGPTAYVAGGIGVVYTAKNNQPLPGQYNVSQTVAQVAAS